jgi:aminoglycoside phosphotransferase (APT) family kinase protein
MNKRMIRERLITEGNPTTDVRKGEELDWEVLTGHLQHHIKGLQGQPEISQYPGGNSNLTYRLQYKNMDLVVRRPPFGTKAKSAHSMIREYRIMTALKPVFPAVPETLYYTDDESVIGAEFYVMKRVEGHVIKSAIPAGWGFDKARTRTLCTNFWQTFIDLHQVDIEEAGLLDFGKPEGYTARQIHGWNGRFRNARTPDVDEFSDVQQWLEQNIPAESGRHSVLHGDYRIDNVIFDRQDPTHVLAVLDWEICALGDPLMDLGNALAYWLQSDDPNLLKGLVMQPSDAPGMMTRREILDMYQDRTGIDTSDFTFYTVYGYFRNAVILQQIYYRYFHGQTQDQRFRTFGEATQRLANHCRGLID